MTDVLERAECDHQWRWSDARNAFVCRRCYEVDEALEDETFDAGNITLRAVIGAFVMFAGFLIVPMHVANNGVWSIAALAFIALGAAVCATAALDLLDERQ